MTPTIGYHRGLAKGLGRRQDAFPPGAPSLGPGASGVDTLPLTPARNEFLPLGGYARPATYQGEGRDSWERR